MVDDIIAAKAPELVLAAVKQLLDTVPEGEERGPSTPVRATRPTLRALPARATALSFTAAGEAGDGSSTP